jgi:hypothetical protein
MAAGVLRQRTVRIGVEAVAVHRILVNRPRGRRDQEQQSARLEHPHHLGEREPEELTVLEHLPGEHDVDRGIFQRQSIRVVQDYVDTLARCQVDREITIARVREQRPVAAIDVGATHVQDDPVALVAFFVCSQVARMAPGHVLER